jgi:hypothetical protein
MRGLLGPSFLHHELLFQLHAYYQYKVRPRFLRPRKDRGLDHDCWFSQDYDFTRVFAALLGVLSLDLLAVLFVCYSVASILSPASIGSAPSLLLVRAHPIVGNPTSCLASSRGLALSCCLRALACEPSRLRLHQYLDGLVWSDLGSNVGVLRTFTLAEAGVVSLSLIQRSLAAVPAVLVILSPALVFKTQFPFVHVHPTPRRNEARHMLALVTRRQVWVPAVGLLLLTYTLSSATEGTHKEAKHLSLPLSETNAASCRGMLAR